VSVSDGDTIRVLDGKQEIRVRLFGIDCPETGQPFGTKAKQFTSNAAFGKEVLVEGVDQDRYERTVADVILPDGTVLNHAVVEAGPAAVASTIAAVKTAGITGASSYLATQGGISVAETGLEWGIASATGADDFSLLESFGKNFAINTLTGGIGGKAKLAGYALRQSTEIGADTTYDVFKGREFGSSLLVNTVGSIGGEAAFKGAAYGCVRSANPSDVAVTRSIGDLRAAGLKDAHHAVQDAAVRDLPGYSTTSARGMQLPGPSTARGTPHYAATQVQRQAGGGTYAAERRIGYKALRRAGYSQSDARRVIQEADEYFFDIGVRPDTPTRIPGSR